MSFVPICTTLDLNGNQGITPDNNTCAWPAGNHSAETKASINSCCGPSNPVLIEDPPGSLGISCYQVCNIKSNGTATELSQAGQNLFNCLNGTLHTANAGHPICTFSGKTVPEKSEAMGLGLGWVRFGALVILVGTALGGL